MFNAKLIMLIKREWKVDPSKAELSLTAFILKKLRPNFPSVYHIIVLYEACLYNKLKRNSHFFSCKIVEAKRLNKF